MNRRKKEFNWDLYESLRQVERDEAFRLLKWAVACYPKRRLKIEKAVSAVRARESKKENVKLISHITSDIDYGMNKTISNLRGLIVPMDTPFKENGDLNDETLRRFTNWLVQQGVHGLYPVSACGEAPRLTFQEKKKMIL